MTHFLGIFIFLAILQLVFIVSVKNPAIFSGKRTKARDLSAIQFFMIFLIVALYLTLFQSVLRVNKLGSVQNAYSSQTLLFDTNAFPDFNLHYRLLDKRLTGEVENYYFLALSPIISKQALIDDAHKIWRSHCENTPCIINIYDDPVAYHIDQDRLNIVDNKAMTKWNEQYYVFVGDHYLGYLGPQENNSFSYYPFRDWFYYLQKSQK